MLNENNDPVQNDMLSFNKKTGESAITFMNKAKCVNHRIPIHIKVVFPPVFPCLYAVVHLQLWISFYVDVVA